MNRANLQVFGQQTRRGRVGQSPLYLATVEQSRVVLSAFELRMVKQQILRQEGFQVLFPSRLEKVLVVTAGPLCFALVRLPWALEGVSAFKLALETQALVGVLL
jgi:hypothetical protein